MVAANRQDVDVSIALAAGDSLPGPEFHWLDHFYVQEWGQTRDVYLHSYYGLDVWDRHFADDCLFYDSSARRMIMISVSELNTLQYDPELCIGCRMCSIVCPHAVFALNGHVAQVVRPDACMECGACQINCPTQAIMVDSGVGCAGAMIHAALTGKKEANCG